MGCVGSKSKEEKYEKKDEEHPKEPKADDTPHENGAAKTDEHKPSPSPDADVTHHKNDSGEPSKKKPSHLIQRYYDNVDLDHDDNAAEFVINRPKINDDETVQDDSVRAEIRTSKGDEKRSTSFLYKGGKDKNELGPFTAEEKKDVTEFLNSIEQMADEQGLFGKLGRK